MNDDDVDKKRGRAFFAWGMAVIIISGYLLFKLVSSGHFDVADGAKRLVLIACSFLLGFKLAFRDIALAKNEMSQRAAFSAFLLIAMTVHVIQLLPLVGVLVLPFAAFLGPVVVETFLTLRGRYPLKAEVPMNVVLTVWLLALAWLATQFVRA